ncbi:MAG: HAD family hydrolase [Cyanobacteria bacterium J06632_22]
MSQVRVEGVAYSLNLDLWEQAVKYCAIATDYDGTLATDGVVAADTVVALKRYQAAGGKLIMDTGRELTDLQQAFPELDLFDGVVVENGAVFYHPPSGELQLLGDPFPEEFVATLKAKQVSPINPGHRIVSTWQPHGSVVQRTIEEMDLQARIIMNKKAVMVLPAGVTKATGLAVALEKLGLAADTVAGIGDAENDLDLLKACGLGVAVANALPVVTETADWVMTQSRGAGVVELIDRLLA